MWRGHVTRPVIEIVNRVIENGYIKPHHEGGHMSPPCLATTTATTTTADGVADLSVYFHYSEGFFRWKRPRSTNPFH